MTEAARPIALGATLSYAPLAMLIPTRCWVPRSFSTPQRAVMHLFLVVQFDKTTPSNKFSANLDGVNFDKWEVPLSRISAAGRLGRAQSALKLVLAREIFGALGYRELVHSRRAGTDS